MCSFGVFFKFQPKLRYRLRTGERSVQLLIVSLLTVPSHDR